MKKAVFNWSGGKDSALALHKVLQQQQYEVVALLTTINAERQLSTMHNIPYGLLQKQAAAIGIPLYGVELYSNGTMEEYQQAMLRAVNHFKPQGIDHFIFGDICLHDVKQYREKQLQPHGIKVVEPLWGVDSEQVMEQFLASGIQTVIVTTMADKLGCSFIGRLIDPQLIADLPAGIDVCGENGEYHTFCFAGPLFRQPVPYRLGAPLHKTFTITMEDNSQQQFSYWFTELQEA